MIYKEMVLGERQTIALEFSRSDGGDIAEASYSMRKPDREWVDNISVVLDIDKVSFTFEPAETGIYLLEVFVIYADGQTDVERVQVTVVGGR